MKYNLLGKSGIKVSAIGMGCWAFGGGAYWGEQAQSDVDLVVDKALDLGINLFDTAEMYNNGESEKSLGLSLKDRRNEAVVCSKISPSNCNNVRKHCEDSLKRLNTDYIDVYVLHWPINYLAVKHFTDDEKILKHLPAIDETYEKLLELKNKGMIRSIGMSNFGHKQMREVIDTGVSVDVNEMPYNIVSRAIEREIVPFCKDKTISIIGSMGLQQGLLAGIYSKPDDVPLHQAHSRHFNNDRGAGTSRHGESGAEEEVFFVVNELKAISAELGIGVAQLSLAWILSKSFIASTLVGSRNLKELNDNISSTTLEIPDEVIKKIDKISLPVLQKMGLNPDYYESTENSRIY